MFINGSLNIVCHGKFMIHITTFIILNMKLRSNETPSSNIVMVLIMWKKYVKGMKFFIVNLFFQWEKYTCPRNNFDFFKCI